MFYLFYAGHVHTVKMQYHPVVFSRRDLAFDRQHGTIFTCAHSICHVGYETCQMLSDSDFQKHCVEAGTVRAPEIGAKTALSHFPR